MTPAEIFIYYKGGGEFLGKTSLTLYMNVPLMKFLNCHLPQRTVRSRQDTFFPLVLVEVIFATVFT